jgi:signal transduction histidine kinase/CheY-like chemotaxis protein
VAFYRIGEPRLAATRARSQAEPPASGDVQDAALLDAMLAVFERSSVFLAMWGIVAGVTFDVALLEQGNGASVHAWAAGLLATQLPLLAWCAARRQARLSSIAPRRWLHAYLVALGCAGFAWGMTPLAIAPFAGDEAFGLCTLAVFGVASAGLQAVVACRWSVLVWLLSVLLPLGTHLSSQHSELGYALALLVVVHGAASIWIGFMQHAHWCRAHMRRLGHDTRIARFRDRLARADECLREKNRFVAAASHDLRQPMHALGLFTSALERCVTTPAGRTTLLNLQRCIDSLDRSFNSVLDIARMDGGTVEPELQSFPVRDLFHRLHLHFGGQAEALGLALRFSAGGKFVRSDPQLLERVLGNLIQNAIRNTRRGGIVVVARSRSDQVSLEVWDTGCGIAAEELPRIFDEFYRGAAQRRDGGRGLGIGLAIVKRLAQLLDHTLTVRSIPGRGSVFAVRVPRTDLGTLHGSTRMAEPVRLGSDETRTLLVVDDDIKVREGTAALLSQWGYSVVVAESADAACHVATSCAGSLGGMVCDLHLGAGADGIETIERVRAAVGHPVPALLVTGDSSPQQIARIERSGHRALVKPVPLERAVCRAAVPRVSLRMRRLLGCADDFRPVPCPPRASRVAATFRTKASDVPA